MSGGGSASAKVAITDAASAVEPGWPGAQTTSVVGPAPGGAAAATAGSTLAGNTATATERRDRMDPTVVNAGGFLALALADLPPMRQFGALTATTFALSMLADFTALPAALWIVLRERPHPPPLAPEAGDAGAG
jgi:hypothetical protein